MSIDMNLLVYGSVALCVLLYRNINKRVTVSGGKLKKKVKSKFIRDMLFA